MKDTPKNLAASIRRRLDNVAKKRNETFGYVAQRFGIERTLYRFSISRHKDRFVLEGATVISNFSAGIHRPTKDIDFLTFGPSSSTEEMKPILLEILHIECPDDGLLFVEESLKVDIRRENEKYQGLQAAFRYEIGTMHMIDTQHTKPVQAWELAAVHR